MSSITLTLPILKNQRKETSLSRYNQCDLNHENLYIRKHKNVLDEDILRYKKTWEDNILLKFFYDHLNESELHSKKDINYIKGLQWLEDWWDGLWSKWFSENFLQTANHFIKSLAENGISKLWKVTVSPSYEGTIIVSWININFSLSIEVHDSNPNKYFSFIKWWANNTYSIKMDWIFSDEIFDSILTLIH